MRVESQIESGTNTMTTSASAQFSTNSITAMAISCKNPPITVSMTVCRELPMRETSSVMRESTSPTGVRSTKLTGRRWILSEIMMRRLQVKYRLTALFKSSILRYCTSARSAYTAPRSKMPGSSTCVTRYPAVSRMGK